MQEIELLKHIFEKFPGVGPKQAERFVYFLLHSGDNFRQELSKVINTLNNNLQKCELCASHFTHNGDVKFCRICSDPKRDSSKLLIVEKETDINKIEKSGAYNGLYFSTNMLISPLKDSKSHARFLNLIKNKIKKQNGIQELIVAFSATFDGDYSAKYIKENLNMENIKISFLARGISTGTEIEYADPETLAQAISNRKNA